MKRILFIIMFFIYLIIFPDINYIKNGNIENIAKKYGELKIVSFYPSSSTFVDKPVNELIITFNKPVFTLTKAKNIKIKYQSSPNIDGVFRVKSKNTIVFIPSKPFDYDKTTSFTIKKGLIAIDSAILIQDYTFNIPPVKLQILYFNLYNKVLHPDSSIFVMLNYPIKIDELSKSIKITKTNSQNNIKFKIEKTENNFYVHNQTKNAQTYKITLMDKVELSKNYKFYFFNKKYMLNPFIHYFSTINIFEYRTKNFNIKYIPFNNESNIWIEFSNPLNLIKMQKYIKIYDYNNNQIDYTITYPYKSISKFNLRAKLKPNKIYKIILDNNIKDVYNNILTNPGTYTFTTGDYTPFIELKQNYIYAPKPIISIYSLNKEYFDIYAKFMNIGEFIKFLQNRTTLFNHNIPYKRYYTNANKNEPVNNDINLEEFFNNKGFLGAGFIQYYNKNVMRIDTFKTSFLFQCSNIEMHAIISNRNGFIFINNMNKPYNLLFSKLLLYNKKGNLIARYPAQNGIFEINKKNLNSFLPFKKKYKQLFIVGISQKDNVFLQYSKSKPQNKLNIFFFAERDLYTYKDTVRLIGLIRKSKIHTMEFTNIRSIEYSIYNYNYETIKQGSVPVQKNGLIIIKFPIEDTLTTGTYYCKINDIAWTNFRIEEFRKPSFETHINPQKTVYEYKETPVFNIKGNYLNGTVMNGDSFYIDLYVERTSFYSQKYNDFDFYIENDTIKISQPYYSISGVLDKNGHATFNAPIIKNILNPVNIKAVATIKDIDKNTISSQQSVKKLNSFSYAGIKLKLNKNKSKLIIQWLIIDNNEVFVKNKKVKILIEKSKDYYFTNPDTIFNKQLISKNKIDTIFEDYDSLFYYNVYLIYDNNTVKTNYSPYYQTYTYTPYIISEKSIYSIGDTAIIKIIPYKDEKRLIFFYGNDSIFDYSIININTDTLIQKIIINESMLPGFYVKVFSLGKDSLSDNNTKSLYLKINNDIKRINATITMDKEEYNPQDTVFLNINTDIENCYAIVSIIDKSVLMLTDYNWDNPLNYFYDHANDAMNYYTSYKLYNNRYMYDDIEYERTMYAGKKEYITSTTEQKSYTKDKIPSIDTSKKDFILRKDFRRTVYFNSNIEIKNGNKQLKIIIPDNLTKYKINVILYTEDKFGYVSKDFNVNKKLMIIPSLPSFLRPFDKFDLSFISLDNTEIKGTITGKIRNYNIEFLDTTQKTLLPEKNKKEFVFKTYTPLIDTARLDILITKDSFYDNMHIDIPIISQELFEYAAMFNNTIDSINEYIEIDTTMIKDLSELSITSRPSIIAGMQLPLYYLYDYKYMCLEQQLSRILPFIIGEKLINHYSLSSLKGRKLRNFVYSILKNIKDYQDTNGGFKYYSDSRFASEYLSVYAMYVIKRAEENNYKINKNIIKKGIEFLEQIIENNFIEQWDYKKITKNSLKAEAIYVLSLYDNLKYKEQLKEIYKNRDYLYSSSKSRLLLSLDKYQLNAQRDTLLSEIISSIRVESEYAYFDDNYRSYWMFQNEIKNTAQILYAILKLNVKFEFSPQIIMFFNKRLKAGWINTHTTAIVLDALYEYYKQYENRNTNFTYFIKFNNKTKSKSVFKDVQDKAMLTIDGKDMIQGKNILTLIKKGSGRLYYTLRLKYALKRQKQFFNGFEVKKSILTLDNKKINKIKRGEIYKIQINIKSNKSRVFVIIDDPLPAGFDIIKKGFQTERLNIINQNKYTRNWYGFRHEEFYKDRCVASAIYLPEGETEYIYYVRAIVSGKFNMPSTNVFEMYNPEVFGHTASSVIVIE